MKLTKNLKVKHKDTPKNIRQYERRMRKILSWILEEKIPCNLSMWDREILCACSSKGYIADNLHVVRTADGSIFVDISGKPRLTHEGYEYLAKLDVSSRSRKAILISVFALIVSVLPLVINYVIIPILNWLSRR